MHYKNILHFVNTDLPSSYICVYLSISVGVSYKGQTESGALYI